MSLKLVSVLGASYLFLGCASTVPRELVDARAAVQRAAEGPSAKMTPAQLHVAQESLAVAEKTFEDEGDSSKARDQAYIAIRKAEIAEAQARTAQLDQGTASSHQLAERAEDQVQANMKKELNQTKGQLASQQQMNASQQQQLEVERQRRQEAERRAQQAAADLARIASVKQETRGMVITLSGSVLFASGKSELLASAQAKLSEIADALVKGNPDAKIVVEGHTDSQGQAGANQELSAARARSVRDYLVAHGIAADRITAEGFGSSRSVAENKTPEGRANNRRVELVVQPSTPPT